MDQLSALKAFCLVVESGGFSAAAAEINVSHTVMSKQVRQLETMLGAQLLNRTTRRIALTEAGQTYYMHARRILDELHDADLAVTRHHAMPTGTLRINAPMAFGTINMVRWLPDFMARYPELKIDLVCNDRFVDLIDEGFDVAVRLARDMPDSSLVARKLATTATMLVASPDYLRRCGTPASPADLAGHNCMTYTLAPKPNEWTLTSPAGERTTVNVSGSFQSNTGIALRSAALAGTGIATLASFIVHEDLTRGGLVAVLPDYRQPPREIFAVYPHNRHLSPKVRAFVDFASEFYRSSDWA